MASKGSVGTIVLAVALTGCTGAAAITPTATPVQVPLPSLANQIRLAEKTGPGVLDYCPKHNGQAPARYELDLPGEPVVGGWCRTAAQRTATNDIVLFRAHWDARSWRRQGTMTLVYSVSHPLSPGDRPTVTLLAQHGIPPP